MYNKKNSITEPQNSIVNMETNQINENTESAIEAMTLQDTIQMGPEEQNEVERSLTELQWQQQLNDQVTGTEAVSQTERGAEDGGRQHPPTQITKSLRTLKPSRQQGTKPDRKATENCRT